MKWVFQILFYLSLVFIGLYLYSFDYLSVPKVLRWDLFLLSFVLCASGFLVDALNWKQALELLGHRIAFRLAVVSTGLSIYTKYIPGKVLVIVGRAAYVAHSAGIPMGQGSAASLLAQLLMLWLGVLLGSVVLFDSDLPSAWSIASAVAFGLLSMTFLFQRQLLLLVNYLCRFFNKELRLPHVPRMLLARASLSVGVGWAVKSLGFYLLVLSALPGPYPSPLLLFAFPLATASGIIALFAPGGLGVREGVLVVCMTLYGIPLDEATGISILSRLWFLAGEVFIFVLAVVLRTGTQAEGR